MIPKVIHYCWFGEKPLPELAVKCIKSWTKFCPDYKIIQWNESNYLINEKCDYVKEAYAAKKWAFVSDYARFDILYQYGGIYFDTDVELISSIEDILTNGAFMGLECDATINNGVIDSFDAASGLGIAAEPNNSIYREILEGYEQRHFDKEKGGDDNLTVVTCVSDLLMKHNPVLLENKIIKVDDISLFPPEFFCPLDYKTGVLNITNNTRSIHHYTASWLTEKEKKWLFIEQKIKVQFGPNIGTTICGSLPIRIIRLFYRRGISGAIKRMIKL